MTSTSLDDTQGVATTIKPAVCSFYRRNTCTRGASCPFIHQPNPRIGAASRASTRTSGTQSYCRHYQMGACRFGSKCRDVHVQSKPLIDAVDRAADSLAHPASCSSSSSSSSSSSFSPAFIPSSPSGISSSGTSLSNLDISQGDTTLSPEDNPQDTLTIPLVQTWHEPEVLAGLDVRTPTTDVLSPAESPSRPPDSPSASDIGMQFKSTLSASALAFEPCAFFTVGICTKGDICAFDHSLSTDVIEDISSDAAYPDLQKDYEDEEGWYENNLATPCELYLQGSCEKGWECEFLHEDPSSQSTHPPLWDIPSDNYAYGEDDQDGYLLEQQAPICKYFLQDNCIMGEKCFYRHEHPSPDEGSPDRNDGKPNNAWKQAYESQSWGDVREPETPRPERVYKRERICKFWSQQGQCKKGDACAFSHIESPADDSQPTIETNNDDEATWNVPWDLQSGNVNTTPAGANTGWTNDEGGDSFSWAQDIEKTGSSDDTSAVVDTDTWGDVAIGPTPWDLPTEDITTADPPAIPSASTSSHHSWEENLERTVPASSADKPEASLGVLSTSTAFDNGWGESADWGVSASVSVEKPETNDDGWPPADEQTPWSDFPSQAKEKQKGTVNEASQKYDKPCRNFLQGNCKKGNACRFLHAGSIPSQRITTPQSCFQFSKGQCERGDACRFFHDTPKSAPKKDTTRTRPCPWFLQGSCKKGDTCNFLHEKPGPVQEGPTSGPSQRKNTPKPCVYYSRGKCKDGNACRNLHEPSVSTPGKDAPQVCVFFSRGNCKKGVACLNIHIPPETNPTLSSERLAEIDCVQLPIIMAEPIDEERRLREDEATWSTPWPFKDPSLSSPRHINEPCKAYGQGHCRFGDNCIYLHLPPPEEPDARTRSENSDNLPNNIEPQGKAQLDSTLDGLERVVFGCNVLFGPGINPIQITTPFEARSIVIPRLHPQFTEPYIYDLIERFGEITSISSTFNDDDASVNYHVGFSKSDDAASAALTLNGSVHHSVPLEVYLDPRSAFADHPITIDCRTIRLVWDAPTVDAWALYTTITQAKQEASRLDGKKIGGVAVQVSYEKQRPNDRVANCFRIKFHRLPAGITGNDLKMLCTGATSVWIGAPVYGPALPVDGIRRLLTCFGPIDTLDILSHDGRRKVTAFCRFIYAETAIAAAASELFSVHQEFLGSGSISVQRVSLVKYRIPRRLFRTVEVDIDCIRDLHSARCKIRCDEPSGRDQSTDHVNLHIYGDEPKFVNRVRLDLDELFRGEELVNDGTNIRDEFFNTVTGQQFVRDINTDLSFFCYHHAATGMVRLFGTGRERVRALLNDRLKEFQSQRHVIGLKSYQILLPVLLNGGLQTLQEKFGITKVSLDVVSRALVVSGEAREAKGVRRCLRDMVTSQHTLLTDASECLCPVCIRPLTNSLDLPCGHSYCTACLQKLVKPRYRFSRPQCISEIKDKTGKEIAPCDCEIPCRIILPLLSPREGHDLLEASFASYLQSSESRATLHHCPTLDCQVVYRTGDDGDILYCPSCLTWICPACHVQSHDGLTCSEYRDSLDAYRGS